MFKSIKNTLSHRIVAIALIALGMTIPLGMVKGVISERHYYYDSVISEISSLWGAQQTISGPILVVPFIEKYETEEQVKNAAGEVKTKLNKRFIRRHAVLLPNDLNIDLDLAEQYRKRGIYNSLVYSSEIKIEAIFDDTNIAGLSNHIDRILWQESELVVGLSDTKAIDKIQTISLNGEALRVTPGVGSTQIIPSGFSARVSAKLDEQRPLHFALNLKVNGSHGIRFVPLGEITRAHIESSWPHPKFAGQILPDSHKIDTQGFKARWEIPHLSRNYPQSWVAEHQELNLLAVVAGVDLFEPVFIYSKITRAVKYGLLFIILTFITFFIFEVSTNSKLHLVQYGLVGFALALFYLLLLSLSEHIAFFKAYLASALSCISMISAYVGFALKSTARGLLLFAILSLLFTLIYTLLRLQDLALLVGTLMLFITLGVLMFITRGLNHLEDQRLDPA